MTHRPVGRPASSDSRIAQSRGSSDDLLNSAFLLACFIHGDRNVALRITAEARAKLEVATAAQYKRLYYRSSGSSWIGQSKAERFRNKVSFGESHLLQRLVYLESEVHEKRKERATGADRIKTEDMLIHFIKHLVKITIRRNSFYVTLGISRLLHNYTTAEAMEVYNAVIQDPERVKDDYYYRSRKGVLLQEIKQRFGDLVQICRGQRGEQKLETDDHPDHFSALVRECLSFFTPWQTPCLELAGANPISDGVDRLSSRTYKSEDEVEVDRIHAVLHPDCYGRILEGLNLDAPDRRLAVPRFFLSTNETNGDRSNEDRDRRHPQKLSADELNSIKSDLDEQSARRKSASAGLLRIRVDGTYQAILNLKHSSRISLATDRDAEIIEVLTGDGGEETLLATHMLAYQDMDEAFHPGKAAIVLEGGQSLCVSVSPSPDDAHITVELAYKETSPAKAILLFSRQLASRLRESRSGEMAWGKSRILVPVLSLVLLLASMVGIREYLKRRTSTIIPVSEVSNRQQTDVPQPGNSGLNAEQRQVAEVPTSKQPSLPVKPRATSASDSRLKGQAAVNTNDVASAVPNNPVSETEQRPQPGTEATRGVATTSAPMSLGKVRSIHLEPVGNGPLARDIGEMLMKKLEDEGRFTRAKNREDADALLRIWVKVAGIESRGSQQPRVEGQPGSTQSGLVLKNVSVTLQLINANGDTIWPLRRTEGQYTGAAERITSRIAKDLLVDSQRHE